MWPASRPEDTESVRRSRFVIRRRNLPSDSHSPARLQHTLHTWGRIQQPGEAHTHAALLSYLPLQITWENKAEGTKKLGETRQTAEPGR